MTLLNSPQHGISWKQSVMAAGAFKRARLGKEQPSISIAGRSVTVTSNGVIIWSRTNVPICGNSTAFSDQRTLQIAIFARPPLSALQRTQVLGSAFWGQRWRKLSGSH